MEVFHRQENASRVKLDDPPRESLAAPPQEAKEVTPGAVFEQQVEGLGLLLFE